MTGFLKTLKARMIVFFSLMFFCFTGRAMEAYKVNTPRGLEIEVFFQKKLDPNNPTVIIAPGGSCNSKSQLFETLDRDSIGEKINFVRFEWAYCLTSSRGNASVGLLHEIEDMKTVYLFLINDFKLNTDEIFFAGKSLGSIVAYSLFRELKNIKSLILLTPICTETEDEAGNPLPDPSEVGPIYYPDLLKEGRSIQFIVGKKDPACQLPHLYRFLQETKGQVGVSVVGGDHGFRILDEAGVTDEFKTKKNFETVSKIFYNGI